MGRCNATEKKNCWAIASELIFNAIAQPIKQAHDQIRKIIYFSDGCAAQYKNRYSFINLIHHYEDFGLKAEWNFFATSHGKNA